MTETLFQPFQLGRFRLPHRMVMAPLTRSRARQPGNAPSAMNACYSAQRKSAALIVSEATQVSQQGQGYAWTPGIHSPDQVEGWRLVTEAVHKAGGLIFMQLWHVGRISHPSLQPDGMLPVAPSAIKPKGEAFIENEDGEGALVPFVTPRALETEEIPYIVQQYVRGAKNALEAGLDGIEIHSANGYLLDQFLNSGTNQRTDAYGGPAENRARLLLEVASRARSPVFALSFALPIPSAKSAERPRMRICCCPGYIRVILSSFRLQQSTPEPFRVLPSRPQAARDK